MEIKQIIVIKDGPNSNFEKELLFKEILATDYLLNKKYEK